MLDVAYLHNSIGNVEWSGVLFYSVISGDITDPSNMILKAERVFPMDKGTTGYTEYEFGPEILDFYENVEGGEDMRIGHIHTHHSMGAFFSGTDSGELADNADNHAFYLSLVVDFKCQPVAKIVYISKVEEEISGIRKCKRKAKFRNSLGVWTESESETEEDLATTKTVDYLNEIDVDIQFEEDDWFKERVAEISKPKVYNNYNYPSRTTYGLGKTISHPMGINNSAVGINSNKTIKENNATIVDINGKSITSGEEFEYTQRQMDAVLLKTLSVDLDAEPETCPLENYLEKVENELSDDDLRALVEQGFDNFYKRATQNVFEKTLSQDEHIALLEDISHDLLSKCTTYNIAFYAYEYIETSTNFYKLLK